MTWSSRWDMRELHVVIQVGSSVGAPHHRGLSQENPRGNLDDLYSTLADRSCSPQLFSAFIIKICRIERLLHARQWWRRSGEITHLGCPPELPETYTDGIKYVAFEKGSKSVMR
jgi:hypothetical protein